MKYETTYFNIKIASFIPLWRTSIRGLYLFIVIPLMFPVLNEKRAISFESADNIAFPSGNEWSCASIIHEFSISDVILYFSPFW